MENLLASIRQAIDEDMSNGTRAPAVGAASAIRGAMEELRAKPSPGNSSREFGVAGEISDLRNKINRSRNVLSEPKTPFAQIMAGQVKVPAKAPQLPTPVPQMHYQAELPQPPVNGFGNQVQQHYDAQGYVEPAQPEWVGEAYPGYEVQGEQPAYGYEQPQLLSHAAADAAQGSFNDLANALMARAMGERSIEDMTQELLKAMLRNWLDTNLPGLVERLVREEIERVARRGR